MLDIEYYRRRMETESVRATEAADYAAATAHSRLADAYSDLLKSFDQGEIGPLQGNN